MQQWSRTANLSIGETLNLNLLVSDDMWNHFSISTRQERCHNIWLLFWKAVQCEHTYVGKHCYIFASKPDISSVVNLLSQMCPGCLSPNTSDLVFCCFWEEVWYSEGYSHSLFHHLIYTSERNTRFRLQCNLKSISFWCMLIYRTKSCPYSGKTAAQ